MLPRLTFFAAALCIAGCSSGPAENAAAPGLGPSPAPAEEARGGEEPANAPACSFAEFRPSLHGFRFVNSFHGSPLPIPLPAAEERLGLPNRFGLCGGMSSAAADLFLAGAMVPEGSTPPERGTPVYDYLYRRQATTLAPMGAGAARFIEWMELPEEGEDGTHARTEREMPTILAALGRGEPVMLGLVLGSPRGERKAWENHQVLAYAASRLPMDVVEIRIYDPNYPGRDDAVIRVAPLPSGLRIDRVVEGRRTTRIRGLFRMPYTPMRPPETLTGP